ncbi:MAG TPA: polyphosphate kinase 2 family protein [Polyangiaceae bacterium]|jgi:PPK2 family polyphosphate:nucleotide phosphotransferase|nr:MAG: Polyphosphate kinase 2 (PPK2) [Deltaproteobacteria bacterium ADurb.Bin207]HNS99762.1 polyphosphate kinase 2 family protein [Polyangiaceae bacterium]HNZ24183.1 polyphosphate kinase 2 family protein [Polyangiaceae bacterium]HOD22540.1 polyphosphate kinase 2 family protein [Polyangiaceae bacterium]HOE49464.1 polyphosphate kinase 2 family protein [Polyangiaceae bacterium]
MKIDRFKVPPGGKGFSLKACSTSDSSGVRDKAEGAKLLEKSIRKLAEIQDVLYAHDRYGILIIFQAMDAAGKDGTIKHVMSGINPQGCQVFSFKSPSAEELDHDYMWRTMRCLPERGRIGIFNRSYYEEVLVVRVHPEWLDNAKLPPSCLKDIWKNRFEDINNIEQYLVRNGIIPIKFFLHLSYEEQLKRFLKRCDDPTKNWKFSSADARERKLWDKYMHAYEDMLRHTSTHAAPWYVVPADKKWFTRVAVSEIIVDRLSKLDLHYPKLTDQQIEDLKLIREQLLSND